MACAMHGARRGMELGGPGSRGGRLGRSYGARVIRSIWLIYHKVDCTSVIRPSLSLSGHIGVHNCGPVQLLEYITYAKINGAASLGLSVDVLSCDDDP